MKHYEVRDGKKVAPTCPECGCRLNIGNKDLEYATLIHYGFGLGVDPRGHKCSLVDNAWVSNRGQKESISVIRLTAYSRG